MNQKVTSEVELEQLSRNVLSTFSAQKIFVFEGNLGAGKTTFIKSLCKQLGVDDQMSSPSFSLINEYHSIQHGNIYHIDCYRIENQREIYDLGIDEIIDSGQYCFIEWPEKIYNLLGENYVRVSIELREKERNFNINLA